MTTTTTTAFKALTLNGVDTATAAALIAAGDSDAADDVLCDAGDAV